MSYKDFNKLNIGCGIKKIEGYWNVDVLSSVKPDEVVDMTDLLPWDLDSFDEILCEYALCQICSKKDFMRPY